MKSMIKKSFIFCLLPVYIFIFCGTDYSDLIIVENGTSQYHIVIAENPSQFEEKAAQELQSYFEKISGVALPIVADTVEITENKIIIGANSHFVELNPYIDIKSLDADGFSLKTMDNRLFITGGTDKGVLYGVYTLLEDYCGCRKLSKEVELIPEKSTLKIPQLSVKQVPHFQYRELHMPDAIADSDFANWHKLDTRQEKRKIWGMWVHTFDDLVPPKKYFKAHPEYFSLNDGKRVSSTQLCLSNPDVLELVVNNLKLKMDQKPDARYWSVSQNDTYGPCECDNCKALLEKYGTQSGVIIDFVNQVAKRFPDKIISTLAYQYSRSAPQNITPAENVNIMLCTIECNRSESIATDERSADFRRDIEDWGKLTDNIILWDYVVQFRNYLDPFPNLRVLQPNLQFFRDNNVRMMFEQGSGTSYSEFYQLRSYLLAKLMWDPDADVDTIKDDFLTGYYGAASDYIGEYITLMHDELDRKKPDLSIYGYPWGGMDSYLAPEFLMKYNALFDEAEAAVYGEPEYLERVQAARLQLDYAILELSKRNLSEEISIFEEVEGSWVVKEDMKKKLDHFISMCEKVGIERLEEHGLIPPREYERRMKEFFKSGFVEHIGLNKAVEVTTTWSTKYPVGGPGALTDGALGAGDYGANYLGFEGHEMEAVIDLGQVQPVTSISTGFCQDIRQWVWIPNVVRYYFSTDDVTYELIKSVPRKSDPETEMQIAERFIVDDLNTKARYIKVETDSYVHCPDWHPGAGGDAWIFVDEVIIK